jgi:hypothetical protein
MSDLRYLQVHIFFNCVFMQFRTYTKSHPNFSYVTVYQKVARGLMMSTYK